MTDAPFAPDTLRQRSLTRRAALRGALGGALGLGLGGLALPAAARAAGDPPAPRVLVLVQLAGGNDGLNTVVPNRDPLYAQKRPRLALAPDTLLPLADKVSLHPSLEPLMPLWKAGELAVVQGVGYREPNRSHFRSSDIWHTASSSREHRDEGWVGALLARTPGPEGAVADAVALSEGGEEPLAARGVRTLSIAKPGRFLQRARQVPGDTPVPLANPALAHVVKTEHDVASAARRLAEHLRDQRGPRFQGGPAGRQLGLGVRLLAGDLGVRVVHVKVGGFDTHAGQLGPHARLLALLARGLADLRGELVRQGLWSRTLVMTYSEFGRRLAENASGGTDHGTASVQLLVGGAVKGGLYGAPPSLRDLEGGDLVATTPFHAVYAEAARHLGCAEPVVTDVVGAHRPLGCRR